MPMPLQRRRFNSYYLFFFSTSAFLIGMMDWGIIHVILYLERSLPTWFPYVLVLLLMVSNYSLTLILALIFSRNKYEKILQRMNQVSRDISKGNVDARIYYRKKDSFHFFSASFDKFIENFLERRKKLENEVEILKSTIESGLYHGDPHFDWVALEEKINPITHSKNE